MSQSQLSRDDMLELMAYADGELDDDVRERVEALLATSAEARSIVASLEPLGEFVRASAATLDGARADGIADGVMARIAAETPAAKPIDFDRARARRAMTMRVAVAGAAITALAAGYALLARPEAVPVAKNQVPVAPSSSAPALAQDPAPSQLAVTEGSGVDVDHVEGAPNNQVSVIYLPAVSTADVNASSVVIWITDDQVSGGP